MKQLSLLIFSTLLLTCCASRRNANKNLQSSTDNLPKKEELVAFIGSDTTASERIQILSVALNGNTLELEVNYAGGCGEHSFKLQGAEMISKSLPPIRGIQLIHTSTGDNCKALITKKLQFNIENLAYKKETGSVIQLQLDGWKEKILYTYN